MALLASAMVWSLSPFFCGDDAAPIIGGRVLGIEFDNLIGVSDTAVQITLVIIGGTADIIGCGELGIEFDRPGRIGNGVIVVTPVGEGEGTSLVGRRTLWIQFDGPSRIGDSVVKVTLPGVGKGAPLEGRRVSGIKPKSLRGVGDGPIQITLLEKGETAVFVSGCIFRVVFDETRTPSDPQVDILVLATIRRHIRRGQRAPTGQQYRQYQPFRHGFLPMAASPFTIEEKKPSVSTHDGH